jgi:hypothetical protein
MIRWRPARRHARRSTSKRCYGSQRKYARPERHGRGYFDREAETPLQAGPPTPRPKAQTNTLACIVAVLVAATDFAFRHALPPSYVSFVHQPLKLRLIYFILRAFNENVFYRLFLFSVLAFCLSRVWCRPDGQPRLAAISLAMVLAQIVNIGLNVGTVTPPESVEAIVYDGVRYLIPGVCWAWLFWKRDFAAAEIASTSCHIFLQPALSRLI